MCRTILLVLAVFLTADARAAEPAGAAPAPSLGLPLRCTPGTDCWIANYIDTDPSARARDYRCGARTYDGHDGVDFAIRDLAAMQAGVPVVASAPGVVRSVRDGMDDTGLFAPDAEQALKGRECGNGVVIRHGSGWQTQYCHLRRDSVVVKPGDRVQAGSVLGAVGMSGWAEFPHVHLAVRRRGVELDPFTGAAVGSGCDMPMVPLWRADTGIGYEPAALFNAGFSAVPPQMDRIRAGQTGQQSIDAKSPALVLWVDMFGVAAGDRIRFAITGPDGRELVAREEEIERSQARRYMFVGKRRVARAWPAGTYTGRVLLSRTRPGDAVPWETAIERRITIQN
jgi:murein DD-endopeptidase MepM/ murein hydrolase activator NlpD